MTWFFVLKREKHSKAMRKKVRTVARPIVNNVVEKYASNKKRIDMEEIRDLVQREMIDSNILFNHPDLSDVSSKGHHIRASFANMLNMATYKIRQMGFKYLPYDRDWETKY